MRDASDAGSPSTPLILDPENGVSTLAASTLGVALDGAYYVSPEGAHVLYGAANRVMLRATAGGGGLDLGAGRISLAAWNADSSLVAWVGFDVLTITDTAGKARYTHDLTDLTAESGARPVSLAWSPDGAMIAIATAPLEGDAPCSDS